MKNKLVFNKKLGRPTKYDPKHIDEVYSYLSLCGREQTKLPTLEGYALHIGVHRDTLYEWAKLYPVFSDALRVIEYVQKEQLINDGIYGGKEINATIVKLLLQNNHGMRDGNDISVQNNNFVPPQTLTAEEYFKDKQENIITYVSFKEEPIELPEIVSKSVTTEVKQEEVEQKEEIQEEPPKARPKINFRF